MKEKRKKIVARVGAMVGAVLLVVLCVVPAFADNYTTEERGEIRDGLLQDYHWVTPMDTIIERTGLTLYAKPYLWTLTPLRAGNVPYGNSVQRNESMDAPNSCSVYLYQISEDMILTSASSVYAVFEYDDSSAESTVAYMYFCDVATDEVIFGYVAEVFVDSSASYAYVIYEDEPYDSSDFVICVFADEQLHLSMSYGAEFGYYNSYSFVSYNDYAKGFLNTSHLGDEWQAGYNTGYDDGMNQTSLINGIVALFTAPMRFVDSVLNFEVFGINMASAVRVLITLSILAVVITIIWKAVK